MSTTTITTAHREYANRPQDERFPSLAALISDAQHQKDRSVERVMNLKDLRAVATYGDNGNGPEGGNTLQIATAKGAADLTHWSFGQLCSVVGAPASYLRKLPPAIAADCLNHGIEHTATDVNLLVQMPNGRPVPLIRAATSERYGRVWDATLYGTLARTLTDRDDRWTLPPTWSGEPAGAYRGDRDSFLILCNGGSIVLDPSIASSLRRDGKLGDEMYRAILVRNSEVGASSISIETILYRYICGNHMLWGAMTDTKFRRRHVGQHAGRDTIREILRIAAAYANAPASKDEALIRALIDHEIASSHDGVIDELMKLGYTKQQAQAAYQVCEATEAASPRSYWGIVQGSTRASQESGYQDERLKWDTLAAQVLKLGRARVAA